MFSTNTSFLDLLYSFTPFQNSKPALPNDDTFGTLDECNLQYNDNNSESKSDIEDESDDGSEVAAQSHSQGVMDFMNDVGDASDEEADDKHSATAMSCNTPLPHLMWHKFSSRDIHAQSHHLSEFNYNEGVYKIVTKLHINDTGGNTDIARYFQQTCTCEPGDGVTAIKRQRHDIHGDGIRDSAMASGHCRLKNPFIFRERTSRNPQPQALGTTFEARVRDYMAAHTERMERFENAICKQCEEINNRMTKMFGLLKELTTSRAPEKGEERIDKNSVAIGDNIEKPTGTKTEMPAKEAEKEDEAENEPNRKAGKEEITEAPSYQPVE
nr:hypothetical protein [Tanacetum cinerariifolium]